VTPASFAMLAVAFERLADAIDRLLSTEEN